MKTLDNYLIKVQNEYNAVTYDVYCEALELAFIDYLTESYFTNNLNEAFFDDLRKMRLARELVVVFQQLKNDLIKIAREFNLNLKTLVEAFKQKDIYQILKAFGFNIKLAFKAIQSLSSFVRNGLFQIFNEIARTRQLQALRRGAIKIDDLIKKYPLLAKVTGIVIAGLLLYIWLNMTFIGDLDYDFNFSDIFAALKGTFSIADLFFSPQGLMLITLFGTGVVFGLSIPWLGKTLYNLVLALIYTITAKLKKKDLNDELRKMKRKIQTMRIGK